MVTEINIVINNGRVEITRPEGELDEATLAGVLRHVADIYDPPVEELSISEPVIEGDCSPFSLN